MKLYELVQEEQHLNELFLSAIDEETGEIKDPQILEELELELKRAFTTKSTGIIKIIRQQEEEINGTENEIKRLQNLKIGRIKTLERFKEYIKFNLKNMDIKKIETSLGTISLRVNPPSTDIFDESVLPKKFFKEKVTYTTSKTDIKKALQNGEEVPGARLIINTSLTIK